MTPCCVIPVAQKINKESSHPCDCVLVVVMTYGESGVLEGTDTALESDKIFEPFKGNKCPKLAGRPKLFIFEINNEPCHVQYISSSMLFVSSWLYHMFPVDIGVLCHRLF